MRGYAHRTKVAADRTKAEIEKLLERHGASQFITGSSAGQALVAFEMKNRRVRFLLPLKAARGAFTENKAKAETRRRWRSLLLVLKAKLEAVASEIVEFDTEFLANIVTGGAGGNTTVGDQVIPKLDSLLSGGALPPLLGPGGEV